MNIAVAGLWHLGCVIAAGLAKAGHHVTGLDPSDKVVGGLTDGHAPISEPGLDDAIGEGLRAGRLTFTTSAEQLLRNADILWIAYDTPVNDDDTANASYVTDEVRRILAYAPNKLLVLVSSQLPAGTIRQMESSASQDFPDRGIRFAYSPENLRLGQALNYFLNPDRIIIGTRDTADRQLLAPVFAPIQCPVEWMTIESAEMAKHAINVFLAMSVAFANELATLCEAVGADAQQVERALKTESRIGPRAYLRPGRAFDGGTLARDIHFLSEIASGKMLSASLIRAIQVSNEHHKGWVLNAASEALAHASSPILAVLGLTYKPGTSTLRRSSAVELCRAAIARGWQVKAYDPHAEALPPDLAAGIQLCASLQETVTGAHAMVVATELPELRSVSAPAWMNWAPGICVIDPARFLESTCGRSPTLQYRCVGLRRTS